MQAASLCFTAPIPVTSSTKNLVARQLPAVTRVIHVSQRHMKVAAASTPDTSTVDYSSPTSVFPAEACETVGGDACSAEMFPEAKPPKPTNLTKSNDTNEDVDREYIEYSEPKTVFPAEACDDLGGEFCEPDYQEGVYK